MKFKIKMPGKNFSERDKAHMKKGKYQEPTSGLNLIESLMPSLLWIGLAVVHVYFLNTIFGLTGFNLILIAGMWTWIIKYIFFDSLFSESY